jgi:large subunit ribosomal protein L29
MAKKVLTAETLRKNNVEELAERLEAARQELFAMRVRTVTKEQQDTSAIRDKRREMARILTIMNQKKAEAGAEAG